MEEVSYGAVCFVCGLTTPGPLTKEHFVPKWLTRRLKRNGVTVLDSGLSVIGVDYGRYYTPCCAKCNQSMKRDLEDPIFASFNRGAGLSGIPPEILSRWLFKIHWAIQYRDHSPRIRATRTARDGEDRWEDFRHYIPNNSETARERILGIDPAWPGSTACWFGETIDAPWMLLPNDACAIIATEGQWAATSFRRREGYRLVRLARRASPYDLLRIQTLIACIDFADDELCPACAFARHHEDATLELVTSPLAIDEDVRTTRKRVRRSTSVTILPGPACPVCPRGGRAVSNGVITRPRPVDRNSRHRGNLSMQFPWT